MLNSLYMTSLLNLNALGLVVKLEDLLPTLLTASAFVLLGLVIFVVAFTLIVFVSPFSVKKEIEEDQNIALAIIIGAIILGISIIIGSAIQG